MSERAVITHHIYPDRRAVIVRASGEPTSSDWRRIFDVLRRDPAFDRGLDWVIVAMDARALGVTGIASLLEKLEGLARTTDRCSRCAVVAADTSMHLELERSLAHARIRHVFVRCYPTETAALRWMGWDAAVKTATVS